MLLKPTGMKDMLEQLRELPEERRRVIVLVGRHLNEGTWNIALRHHKDWERTWAATVRIPVKWTPQYIWHHVRKRGSTREAVRELFKGYKDDSAVSKQLFNKFHVPVVSFHGTGQANPRKPGLPALTVDHHPKQPNTVVVEYWFQGNDVSSKSAAWKGSHALWDAYDSACVSGDIPVTHTTPDYVTDVRISKQALDTFTSKHEREFEQLLQHVAISGLDKFRTQRRDGWINVG